MNKVTKLYAGFLCVALMAISHNAIAQNIESPQEAPETVKSQPTLSYIMPEAEILPDVMMNRQTHPEKIIFTQLKLAGGQPDFDAFSKVSPIVEQASDIDKSVLTISEYNRLANSFSLHNQKQDIIVHTTLKLDEYSSLQDLLVFDELHNGTFFQYGLYGYNVGIVPEKIDEFSNLQLSKPRAENLFQRIDGETKVNAEFVLQPVYADIKDPFILKEKQYWLMFARIAEFRLWSGKNPSKAKLLWFYRAPWYQKTSDENIDDLYESAP